MLSPSGIEPVTSRSCGGSDSDELPGRQYVSTVYINGRTISSLKTLGEDTQVKNHAINNVVAFIENFAVQTQLFIVTVCSAILDTNIILRGLKKRIT